MGRRAAESGEPVTYEQALAAEVVLAPGLDGLKSIDDPAPVRADAEGRYPVPVPPQAGAV